MDAQAVAPGGELLGYEKLLRQDEFFKGRGEEAWGLLLGGSLVSSTFLLCLLKLPSAIFSRLVPPNPTPFCSPLDIDSTILETLYLPLGLRQRVFHKPSQQLLRLTGQELLVSFYK